MNLIEEVENNYYLAMSMSCEKEKDNHLKLATELARKLTWSEILSTVQNAINRFEKDQKQGSASDPQI